MLSKISITLKKKLVIILMLCISQRLRKCRVRKSNKVYTQTFELPSVLKTIT